jgi:hypothetical protein
MDFCRRFLPGTRSRSSLPLHHPPRWRGTHTMILHVLSVRNLKESKDPIQARCLLPYTVVIITQLDYIITYCIIFNT